MGRYAPVVVVVVLSYTDVVELGPPVRSMDNSEQSKLWLTKMAAAFDGACWEVLFVVNSSLWCAGDEGVRWKGQSCPDEQDSS